MSRKTGPSGLSSAQAQKLTANPMVAMASISHGDRVAARVGTVVSIDVVMFVTSALLMGPTDDGGPVAALSTVEAVKKGEGRRSRLGEPSGSLGPRGGSPDRRLSASAARVLAELRSGQRPIALSALSESLSLHPNTVREHLDTLVRAGLASRAREQPHGRGRPAWTYQATAAITETSEYAALAVVLSSTIARTSAQPGADAAMAGEEWGRDLARGRGAAPTTAESARDRAVELLDDLGFEPRQDSATPSAVRLTRCPLLQAARTNPQVVCSVHLGMLRGALEAYGADPTGSALEPFAEPGACLLVIPPV